MRFMRVAGQNFRLFSTFEFEPRPGLNLIHGVNAAGKTTLLEALYALGRGRGFRGAASELAGTKDGGWRLQGRAARADRPELALGIGWTAAGLKIRIDQAEATLQDLVQKTAVQVLEPDSHRLLEDGPVYRRRYLDWGVFHVEHRFFPAWRSYQRALRQRNQALRAGTDRLTVEAWNDELSQAGETVQSCRAEHVRALQEPLKYEMDALLGGCDWSLELCPGWTAGRSLAEILTEHYEQDRRFGATLAGPHRAELRLRLSGRSTKHHASRGQQKLLIAALLLAQARLIERHTGDTPVLLIDDFPAELGPDFQAVLLETLQRYGGQCFLTSTEVNETLSAMPKKALFHVEHGTISSPSLV